MNKKVRKETRTSVWRLELETLFDETDDRELLTGILDILETLQKEKKERFKRALPFGEYFSDRWIRAETLGFGTGASIYESSVVLGEVTVGNDTWIGPNTLLDGSGGISIGSFCSISAGVQIYSHDSVQWAVSGGEKPYEYAATSIGDNCYIGPNSIISKGVSIGHGSIIGANSFVNRNVSDGQKFAGNPAKALHELSTGRDGE
jgi:acetyltransferase-like isoleucine patch superfamily enzyme